MQYKGLFYFCSRPNSCTQEGIENWSTDHPAGRLVDRLVNGLVASTRPPHSKLLSQTGALKTRHGIFVSFETQMSFKILICIYLCMERTAEGEKFFEGVRQESIPHCVRATEQVRNKLALLLLFL